MKLSAIIGIITIALVWCCPVAAPAQQNPSVFSAKTLTREKFEALPPDAVIELPNGEHITKQDFVARTTKAFEEAKKNLEEWESRAQAEFEQRRKKFYDDQNAALAEANKKVEAEVNRLVEADNAAHGQHSHNGKQCRTSATDAVKRHPAPRRLIGPGANFVVLRRVA
jgi:hypothetical protein